MKPKDFLGKQAYKRYIYALKIGTKLKAVIDGGGLVFDNQKKPLEGRIELTTDLDNECHEIVSLVHDNCTMILVHIEYWCGNGKPWVPSIAEMKEVFSDYSMVMPKDIHKLEL